ncbi:hypothetical protein SAMN05444408_10161 [Chryseobacterium takakiae]|uniref:Outer membrane protein beta-barrel domain-containing protein n=2 Tax=Chryseobacterium takakiae TaxID=1302685 RepID=A0A1M4SV56_9FLAO|nr:hypothetical protein SAMN05444408_10161 [Chryseobacterium takakiae]
MFTSKKEIHTKMISTKKVIDSKKNIEGFPFNIFSFIFLLYSSILYSQKSPIQYGITAGWNHSIYNDVNANGEKNKGDSSDEMYGGIIFEKRFSKKSAIRTALLISYTDSVTFLEFPVLYKYIFYNRFSIFLGPKIDYIIKQEWDDVYKLNNKIGFSTSFGIEYRLTNNLYIEASYSHGYTNQLDTQDSSSISAKRNLYRMGLTYFFKF